MRLKWPGVRNERSSDSHCHFGGCLRNVYRPIEMTGTCIIDDCGYVGHGFVNRKHKLSCNSHHRVDNTNVTQIIACWVNGE